MKDIEIVEGEVSPKFICVATCIYNNKKIIFKSEPLSKKKIARNEVCKQIYNYINDKKTNRNVIDKAYEPEIQTIPTLQPKIITQKQTTDESIMKSFSDVMFNKITSNSKSTRSTMSDNDEFDTYANISFPNNIYILIDLSIINGQNLLKLQFVRNIKFIFIGTFDQFSKFANFMGPFEKSCHMIKVLNPDDINVVIPMTIAELLLNDKKKDQEDLILMKPEIVNNINKIVILTTDSLIDLSELINLLYDKIDYHKFNIEQLHTFLSKYRR